VPISGDAGVGYSLMDGYRLPPVMFTSEEAGSFVAAEQLMKKFSDKGMGDHYESAMYKVKSVLRGVAKDRVASLESQIRINTSQELFNPNTPNALNILFNSIADKKQVALKYQSLSSEELVDRMIEPVGLLNENNFWYVMAFCHLRKDYRQFRTDRMFGIQQTDLPFIKKHEHIQDFRSMDEAGEKTKVVIRVDKDVAVHLKSGRKYYGFVSETAKRDKVEMTFMTCDVHDGLTRWYMMFADCAEIVEPESFRQRVSEVLEKSRARLNNNKYTQKSVLQL
jgi:predicted DNA-binding transcriptional regulator YafY